MSGIAVSIDVPVKTMDTSMTVMGEIMGKDIQYQIEGGGMSLTQEQAEDIARSILRCIKKTRSLYRKVHGENAP